MRTPGPALAAAVVVAALVAFAGCSGDGADRPGSPPSPAAATTPAAPDDPALDVALSEPVEDRYYPEVGDPGVDALHYDLDLAWDPETSRLEGVETLTFRSTRTASSFRLDLAPELDVTRVRVDGDGVGHDQRDKDLVVRADVETDRRYVVELAYAGTPAPVASPTRRSDAALVGWTTMSDGSTWTMQEPFGAYTWYAVNDHPSDKALYDLTLRVPDPMVGVANGELVSRTSEGGDEVTGWHLAEPAASYLMTVAFDEFVTAEETSAGGTPVTLWWPADESEANLEWLRGSTVQALDWAEEKLGPYPFDSLGFLFVPSRSGMETQTMITLGLTDYTTSLPVQVHEVVHQWWGNQVTPRDWRDLWLNEGMTMYLQLVWEDENDVQPLAQRLAEIEADAPSLRADAGPPAAYDRRAFAESNVYYLPALMWHEVRAEIGDEEFFRLVREWPASRDNGHADYDEIVAWWSRESGTDLAPLFDDHLLGEDQPA